MERANQCFSLGDYSTAQVLLRGAAAEFPDDAEIADLGKRAQEGVKRKAEADRLITESQEQFAQQRSAEAILLLREAYELDKKNSLARSILANALIEQAQSVAESDWWETETLANEALRLNPAHPTAKTIHTLIFERKMAGAVEEWVSQTRQLQSAGKLTAALSQIAEALVLYPHDAGLLQIQDAVQREYGAQFRQARRRDLEQLRHMASEIDEAADDAARKIFADRIHAMTAKHSTDGEILTVANGLLQRIASGAGLKKSPTEPADGERVAGFPDVPAASVAGVRLGDGRQIAPSQNSSNQNSPNQNSPSQIPRKQDSQKQIPLKPDLPGWIAMTNVLPSTVPSNFGSAGSVSTINIAPRVSGSSASASIETARRISLPSAMPAIEVAGASPKPQLPQSKTEIPAAEDYAKAEEIPSQSAQTTAPSPAQPTWQLTTLAEQPTLSNSTRMILAAVAAVILIAAISYVAGTHHALPVVASRSAASIGKSPAAAVLTVSAPAQTIAVPSVAAAHPFPDTTAADTGAAGAAAVKVAPELRNTPAQPAHIRTDDSARVFSPQPENQQPQTLQTQPLQTQPQAQSVPPPLLATLAIRGAAAGTAVSIDQTPVGTIQTDGTLSISTIDPGDHTVELRKERFKPLQWKKHFVAGGVISLTAADTTLEPALGQLKITFSPADATVAIVKGDILTTVSSGVPISLAAGTYTLTARTADRFTRSSTLEVVAGQSRTLDLSLAPNGMSKWEDAGDWKQEGNSFAHRGGGFVLYGDAPASGSFIFSAMATKGRFLQWVINYTDARNYVLFQMDENNFYRSVIRNGVKTDEIIVPDKGDKKSLRDLRIRVSATEIVHQIRNGNSWSVLDRWTQPGANLSAGKFGFYIPGNDQVSLSGFTNYADLNIR